MSTIKRLLLIIFLLIFNFNLTNSYKQQIIQSNLGNLNQIVSTPDSHKIYIIEQQIDLQSYQTLRPLTICYHTHNIIQSFEESITIKLIHNQQNQKQEEKQLKIQCDNNKYRFQELQDIIESNRSLCQEQNSCTLQFIINPNYQSQSVTYNVVIVGEHIENPTLSQINLQTFKQQDLLIPFPSTKIRPLNLQHGKYLLPENIVEQRFYYENDGESDKSELSQIIDFSKLVWYKITISKKNQQIQEFQKFDQNLYDPYFLSKQSQFQLFRCIDCKIQIQIFYKFNEYSPFQISFQNPQSYKGSQNIYHNPTHYIYRSLKINLEQQEQYIQFFKQQEREEIKTHSGLRFFIHLPQEPTELGKQRMISDSIAYSYTSGFYSKLDYFYVSLFHYDMVPLQIFQTQIMNQFDTFKNSQDLSIYKVEKSLSFFYKADKDSNQLQIFQSNPEFLLYIQDCGQNKINCQVPNENQYDYLIENKQENQINRIDYKSDNKHKYFLINVILKSERKDKTSEQSLLLDMLFSYENIKYINFGMSDKLLYQQKRSSLFYILVMQGFMVSIIVLFTLFKYYQNSIQKKLRLTKNVIIKQHQNKPQSHHELKEVTVDDLSTISQQEIQEKK